MAAKKKTVETTSGLSWDDVIGSLEASARGIDATAMDLDAIERLFNSLPDDEAERIAERLREATEEIRDDKALIATIVDTISDVAGITLKLMA